MANNSDKRNKYIADATTSYGKVTKTSAGLLGTPLSTTLWDAIKSKDYTKLKAETAAGKDLSSSLSKDEAAVLFWRAAVDESSQALEALLGNTSFKGKIEPKVATVVLWQLVDLLQGSFGSAGDEHFLLSEKIAQSTSFTKVIEVFGSQIEFNKFSTLLAKPNVPAKYTDDQFKTVVLELAADVCTSTTAYEQLLLNPAIAQAIPGKIDKEYFATLFNRAYVTEELFKGATKDLAKFLNTKYNTFFKVTEDLKTTKYAGDPSKVTITTDMTGYFQSLDTFRETFKTLNSNSTGTKPGNSTGSKPTPPPTHADKQTVARIVSEYKKHNDPAFSDLKTEINAGVKDDSTFTNFKAEVDKIKDEVTNGNADASSLKAPLQIYTAYTLIGAKNKSVLSDPNIEIDRELCLIAKKGTEFIVRKLTIDTQIQIDANSVIQKAEISSKYSGCMRTSEVSSELGGNINVEPTNVDAADYLIKELSSVLA